MKHSWETSTSVNIDFDIEIEGEEQRMGDLVAFAKMHNLFHSQNQTPFWSDYDHEMRRVGINFHRRINNTPSKIEVPQKVIDDAKELLSLLQDASDNSQVSIDPQFRFRCKNIIELNEVYARVTKELDIPNLPIIYKGQGYTSTDFEPYYMYELAINNDQRMLVKLKFEDTADLFNEETDDTV